MINTFQFNFFFGENVSIFTTDINYLTQWNCTKRIQLKFTTHLLNLKKHKESNWSPKVALCSSLNNTGIESIHNIINAYLKMTKKNGYFYSKRNAQNKNWFLETINAELKRQFYKNGAVKIALDNFIKKIENQEISPYQAAQKMLLLNK